jgi:hypothetical protein
MRNFVGSLVIGLSLHPLTIRANDWEELRKRRGNDDIFVMVDTSLSMAPSLGGSLRTVKWFLQDLLVRYVREGDRVIIMTFDSEARVRSVVPILDRPRDVELLRDTIDGIDVHRLVRYSGTYPNLVEARNGPFIGGGAWTDYCEMWRLSATALQRYSQPSHRQLFLLFAGGRPTSPPYRPCSDPGVSSSFWAGLREDRFRMGVLALPSAAGSARELSASLSALLQHMPGYEQTAKRALRFMDLAEEEGPIHALRRDVLDLLNSRVDLVEPASLVLGSHYEVNLNAAITLVNRSNMPRTVTLRGAVLNLGGTARPIAVTVTPSTIVLPPGRPGTFLLAAPDLLQQPGEYRGLLELNFGTGSRFSPAMLEFSATKLSWWQAFGSRVRRAFPLLLAIALLWTMYGNRRHHSKRMPCGPRALAAPGNST